MLKVLAISFRTEFSDQVCSTTLKGCEVGSCTTLDREGVCHTYIQEYAPDLIMVDGGYYVCDTYDICRKLKGDTVSRGVPLAVVWPGVDGHGAAQLVAAGADVVFDELERADVIQDLGVLLRLRGGASGQASEKLVNECDQRNRADDQTDRDNHILMDVAEAVIVIMDGGGRIQSLNKWAQKVLGESAAEVVGENWITSYVSVEYRERLGRLIERLRHDHTGAVEIEHSIQTKGGTERMLRCRYSSRRDRCGKLVGVVVSGQDVTMSRRIETALHDSESRYETMARISPVGLFRTDGDGCYVYVNQRWSEITGLKRDQVWQERWLDGVVEEDRRGVERRWNQLVEHGEPFKMEFRIQQQSGQWVWVYSQVVVERNAAGEVSGYLGTVSDITEQKNAEVILRNYENMVESSEDLLFALDHDYRFIIANQAFLRHFNLQRDEVIGHRAAVVMEQGFFDENLKPNFDLCLKGRFIQYERPLQMPGQGERYISESMFPLVNQHGQVSGIVASIRDITDRKAVERQLMAYQAQLKRLSTKLSLTEERERRRIAVELHDRISQTLVFAKMKVDLLQDHMKTAAQRKPLGEVADLIHETLDNVHRLTHELSYPVLYEMGFEAAVSAWVADQKEKIHDLPIHVYDDGKAKPLGEEVQLILFRAVRELVNNAVKHAQATEIEVEIRRVGNKLELVVEDNGLGFEGQERVVNPSLNSGFGLFDIRERLEPVDGTMVIRSKPTEGAKIVVRVPLKEYTEPLESRIVYDPESKQLKDNVEP